ncbi:MAG: hypothetical protein Q7J08_09130 [Methanocorpusculum sp.]|nr:hypothetical protein [Methanocorpusculum sp.]MDO9523853.1 hypothetical protein [Methanocorpusculum sp.]
MPTAITASAEIIDSPSNSQGKALVASFLRKLARLRSSASLRSRPTRLG